MRGAVCFLRTISALIVLVPVAMPVTAQQVTRRAPELVVLNAERADGVPELGPLASSPVSPLAPVVERYTTDRQALSRRWDTPLSADARARKREFFSRWQSNLEAIDFNALGREGRVDYILLDHRITYELSLIDREEKSLAEMRPLLPAMDSLLGMHARWRRREAVVSRESALVLYR
jgi:hypothetical protein